jgi:RHS repeat-associated protein
MARPSDWIVLDLDEDPTPGDPTRIDTLADRFLDFSETAEHAYRSVTSLQGDSAVMSWVGLSGDAFREHFGGFPDQLRKLYTSHEMVGDALTAYSPQLSTAQAQADRALADGREARDRLNSASLSLTSATADSSGAATHADSLKNPDKSAPPPDPEQVAQAVRDAQAASTRQSSAQGAVDSAQAALDAAKNLAAQAAGLRDSAAKACAQKIDDGSDAGIKPRSFWQKLAEAFKKLWDIICEIAKWVALVAGIIAMIIGGPLAWVAFAAGIILLIKAVVDYAQGHGSIMDLVFGIIGIIPGVKGLTTLGNLKNLYKLGGLKAIGANALKNGKSLVIDIAKNLKNAGAGLNQIIQKGFGNIIGKINEIPKFTSKEIKDIPACGDPVDVATGRMFLSQNDLRLPGQLPLSLDRTHLTDHRIGRAFGPTWASWLDQRLVVEDDAVHLVSAEGMLLSYPVPDATGKVLPVHGMAAPLRRTEQGLAVDNPDGQGTLYFAPVDEEGDAVLVAVVDPAGNRIEVDRDEFGRITLIRHSGGYRVAVESNEAGLIVALRMLPRADAPADNHGESPVLLRSFTYDEKRRLVAVVDNAGREQRYDYDKDGRIVRWLDRNGMWFSYEYDDEGRCVRTVGKDGYLSYRYDYDPARGVTRVTDSLGHVSTYTLNDELQLVAETDPLGGTTRSEWDIRHHLLARTDALGSTTRYLRNDAGDVVAVEEADGQRMTIEYSAPGKISVVTGPDGARWGREYDDAGRLVSATDPAGLVAHYGYDDAIRTDGALHETVERDAAGLPMLIGNAAGQTLRLRRDRFGRPIELLDEQGNRTTYGYTPDGELAERVDPTGLTERWLHDGEGNIVAYTDGAGRTSTTDYAGFDLPVAVVDPSGARTQYRYDTELRMVEVINPEGQHWHYEYDAAGRVIAETDFDGRRTEYGYDAADRLVREVSPAGEATEYELDGRGNVTLRRTLDGETRYRYDAADRMVQAIGADAEIILERDEFGQVIAETVNGRTVHTSYDVSGRVTGRLTPAGGAAIWQYDRVGRPVQLHTAHHELQLGYDSVGRESFRQLDGRVLLSRDTDAAGRSLGHIVLAGDLTGAPEALRPVHWQRIGYGADADPIQITDDNGTRTMELDAGGRILAVRSEDGVAAETYAYNGNSDLVSADWAGAGGAGGSREYSGTRVVRAGDTRYDYDANGRTVSRDRPAGDGQRYTWNAEGRLVGVVTSDGRRWRYRYDPFGRRLAKERLEPVGPKDRVVERTEYVWAGDLLVEEMHTDESGRSAARTWHRLGADSGPLAQYEQLADGEGLLESTLSMVVNDVVGTPSALIDPDGELRWRREGTIWGRDDAGTEPGIPIRMPGQYLDVETGFHYNNQRYYDPETGRYLSSDPLGLAPASNPVAYVPNPLIAYDPLGLAPCGKVGGAGGSGGGKKPDRWDPYNRPDLNKGPKKKAPSKPAQATAGRDFTYGGLFPDGGGGYVTSVGLHKHVGQYSAQGIRESEHVVPMKALEYGGLQPGNRAGENNEIAMSIPYGAHQNGSHGYGNGVTSTGSGDVADGWARLLGGMMRNGDNYNAYRSAIIDELNVDRRSAPGLMHYLDEVQAGRGLPAGQARLTPQQIADLKNMVINRYLDYRDV